MNIMLLSDSYKYTHKQQYPKGTTEIYSYLESRGGKFPRTVFFGLQMLIKKYLEGKVVTKEKIDEAETIINAHMGPGTFNREGWEYILEQYDGRLPVLIKAVPEGSVVNNKNVLLTIQNIDPNCFWLTNFLETLLVQLWYPITVATQSYYMKQYIRNFLLETQGQDDGLEFKLHDFGFRGVSSVESAEIGGLAHILNFSGTDTVASLVAAQKYYNVDPSDVVAYSIPASEHSTMTAWGPDETNAYENMLDQFEQYPLIACVSDSYDIFNACRNIWGSELKDKVMNRNGTLVIRPDSGNPTTVVPDVLDVLGEAFGYSINEKGYKILPPQVRVIQGDGINYDSGKEILQSVKSRGWSTDNVTFGMGGALLQDLNRDTQKFAMKCSNIIINDKMCHVYKSPVTDPGKESKRGYLK